MDTGFHALQTDSTATYNVLLSDGTKVTLNSNTVLRYPVVFYAHRDVWLDGEAYFQVHHESKRGFAVHAKGVKVSVLGTKFNVKVTREGNVEVCLTSGSVLVSTPQGEMRIKPGEKCIYSAANKEFEVGRFKRAEELKWIGDKTLSHIK
jgi:ferric-dicitrate binding protein FerR (iron transport regulator)